MTYLESEESTFHAEIGTDVLVDGPGKLIIQLPGNESHGKSENPNDTGNHEQEGFDVLPEGCVRLDVSIRHQLCDGLVDLIILDRGINEHATVVDTQADDLNGILESQRVVNKDQLVEETEDKEGEVGRDRLGDFAPGFVRVETLLDVGKQVSGAM